MTKTLMEQLADAHRSATAVRDEIIRLETEIRKLSALKTGDYVKITDATSFEGQYGRIVHLDDPASLCPYYVDVLPYHKRAYAYSVESVKKSEVTDYLRKVAASLT